MMVNSCKRASHLELLPELRLRNASHPLGMALMFHTKRGLHILRTLDPVRLRILIRDLLLFDRNLLAFCLEQKRILVYTL